MYDNVYSNIDGYFGTIKDNKYFKCGRGFSLDDMLFDIEDETFSDVLSTTLCGHDISVEMPRKHLMKKYMDELQDKGFDVNESNFTVFTKAVQNEEVYYEANNEAHYKHKYVGWQDVALDGVKQRLFKSFDRVGNTPSEYCGEFDIEPMGTYEAQLDMINKEVLGNIPLEAVLCVGGAAVVNGYIGKDVNVSNIIVHLYGDSTQGKSTAAKLAVSIAGSCELESEGLFMSWNATYNNLITRMKGNFGMPIAYDEISKFQGRDISCAVYDLVDGKEKGRNNKDGNKKKASKFDSWHTAIISTGEASLLEKCKKNNTGLLVRVFEFCDVFTKSAENAEAINESVQKNYGHIAPRIAEALVKMGYDNVRKLHQDYKEDFIKRCADSPQIERLAGTVAIFAISAYVMKYKLKIDIDINGVIDYFLNNIKENSQKRDMAETALEKVLEYIQVHSGRFFTRTIHCGYAPNDYEYWGRIDDGKFIRNNDGKIAKQYIIYHEQFCKILNELGYEDADVVLRALKKKDYLDCEKDKLYRTRKIKNIDISDATKVAVINIFAADDNTDDEKPEIKKQPKPREKTSFDEILETIKSDDYSLPDFINEDDDEDDN